MQQAYQTRVSPEAYSEQGVLHLLALQVCNSSSFCLVSKATPNRPRHGSFHCPFHCRSQPAPAAHQGPTKEERAIEAAKQRNRHDQLQKFTDPAHGPFHLRTSERPTNTQLLKQQVGCTIHHNIQLSWVNIDMTILTCHTNHSSCDPL